MEKYNDISETVEDIKRHLELSFEVQGQINVELVQDIVVTTVKISVKTTLFEYEHYYRLVDYEGCYQIATRFTQDYAEYILHNFIGMRVDCLFDGHFLNENWRGK